MGSVLNTCHNLHFYLDLMGRIRQSIRLDCFEAMKREFTARYTAAD
jgi:tRNA-guanine family transglycosylase